MNIHTCTHMNRLNTNFSPVVTSGERGVEIPSQGNSNCYLMSLTNNEKDLKQILHFYIC